MNSRRELFGLSGVVLSKERQFEKE